MQYSIYVFRSGQSEDEANKVFCGLRESPLTENGLWDAKIVAAELRTKAVALGISSHLQRAVKTMGEVLKFHPGAKLQIDDRVIERSYGKLQGIRHAEMVKKNPELFKTYHRSYDVAPPEGESIEAVEGRTCPFCKELIERVKKEKINVALVCGNNSMRTVRRFFENLSIEQMMKLENPYDKYFEYKIDD